MRTATTTTERALAHHQEARLRERLAAVRDAWRFLDDWIDGLDDQ